MRGQKLDRLVRVDGAIILHILNFIGRFFKLGMETKQFPSPDWSKRKSPNSSSFVDSSAAFLPRFDEC